MGRRVGVLAIVLVPLCLIALLIAWRTGAFQGTPPAFCPTAQDSDATAETYELPGRAAPYRGGAPHPLLVFDVRQIEPRDSAGLRLDGDMEDVTGETGLPPDWRATGATEPGIQLIVCQYRHGVGDGEEIGRCRNALFTTAPVLAATFTYRVYEAATAKPLGRFDLPGTAYTCPEWMNRRSEQIPTYVLPKPDPAALAERLRPFATAG
ncbi:hypothetical protein [Amycolatopsis coloradensis]|uniref:hypothetical protein n=1 Tax=Amycolatopsis coloradensis TaxID=76021 RepID=UPI00117770C6|nr:hypothetical protein [Amycolatopsis coloradensis]